SSSTNSALNGNNDAVKDGEHKFTHHFPTGNGRACATCHVEEDSFALLPSTVEAHLQALPRTADGTINSASDPLFQSIDADDFDQNFTRLREGLARVVIPLPSNITVDEFPGATGVPLFRGVPSINNIALTKRFILSDGRAATLQDQATGAAQGHIQV